MQKAKGCGEITVRYEAAANYTLFAIYIFALPSDVSPRIRAGKNHDFFEEID